MGQLWNCVATCSLAQIVSALPKGTGRIRGWRSHHKGKYYEGEEWVTHLPRVGLCLPLVHGPFLLEASSTPLPISNLDSQSTSGWTSARTQACPGCPGSQRQLICHLHETHHPEQLGFCSVYQHCTWYTVCGSSISICRPPSHSTYSLLLGVLTLLGATNKYLPNSTYEH